MSGKEIETAKAANIKRTALYLKSVLKELSEDDIKLFLQDGLVKPLMHILLGNDPNTSADAIRAQLKYTKIVENFLLTLRKE